MKQINNDPKTRSKILGLDIFYNTALSLMEKELEDEAADILKNENYVPR